MYFLLFFLIILLLEIPMMLRRGQTGEVRVFLLIWLFAFTFTLLLALDFPLTPVNDLIMDILQILGFGSLDCRK